LALIFEPNGLGMVFFCHKGFILDDYSSEPSPPRLVIRLN
jgi:hypothetical protein